MKPIEGFTNVMEFDDSDKENVLLLCKEPVGTVWNSGRCGHAAKGYGRRSDKDEFRPMCGIHMNGLKRREKNDRAWRAEYRREEERKHRRELFTSRLRKLTGIEGLTTSPDMVVVMLPVTVLLERLGIEKERIDDIKPSEDELSSGYLEESSQ